MLNQVLTVADEEGWFDVTQPYSKTIYLTRGYSHRLLLCHGRHPVIHLKFSSSVSLEIEGSRCAAARRIYGDLTPDFLGYGRRGDLEVIALRGVDFQPLTAGSITSGRGSELLLRDLAAYFTRSRSHGTRLSAPWSWLHDFQEYFRGKPEYCLALASAERIRQADPPIFPASQHCDLVLNNLGIRESGHLVVFDWEDFGAVDLPGLDLYTLWWSIAEDGDTERLENVRFHGLDVDRMCDAIGLSRSLFESLELTYALVFRFLKRGYGPEVRGRLDGVISRILSDKQRLPSS